MTMTRQSFCSRLWKRRGEKVSLLFRLKCLWAMWRRHF